MSLAMPTWTQNIRRNFEGPQYKWTFSRFVDNGGPGVAFVYDGPGSPIDGPHQVYHQVQL